MADAWPSASMRRFSASASASTMILAFSALAGASRAARRSASTRSAWARAALARARFWASCTAASASRLRVSPSWKASACLTCRVACGGGHVRLGQVLAGDGLGVGVGQGDAHRPLGVLDLGVALEAPPSARRPSVPCPARRCARPVRAGLRACRSRAACWRWPPGWHLSRSASATPISPSPLLLGHVDAWPAAPPATPPSGRWPGCSPIRR